MQDGSVWRLGLNPNIRPLVNPCWRNPPPSCVNHCHLSGMRDSLWRWERAALRGDNDRPTVSNVRSLLKWSPRRGEGDHTKDVSLQDFIKSLPTEKCNKTQRANGSLRSVPFSLENLSWIIPVTHNNDCTLCASVNTNNYLLVAFRRHEMQHE